MLFMIIIDDLKDTTNTEPSMDDPDYEDDKLGATMMEMDVGKIKKDQVGQSKQDTGEKEESVDELLKKQKSIIGRIGNIFGKK
ncbi:MAG: hypothetical protein ACD_73C00215G0002 [uncultured bacterium]|nr:MAG: hypothetical protein ACD_73C00215G0002 [uncultured bacterium]